jgi:hypothetical protein
MKMITMTSVANEAGKANTLGTWYGCDLNQAHWKAALLRTFGIGDGAHASSEDTPGYQRR